MVLDGGMGIWSPALPKGGVISVFPGPLVAGVVYPPWSFQIGLSDSGKKLIDDFIFNDIDLSDFFSGIPRPRRHVTAARRHHHLSGSPLFSPGKPV